jgi:polyferredoxin
MQSVLMDANSLVIAYDKKRGEPRRGTTARENEGDCINCYACVKVCPTGIDIRRGTQLECIACTNCIDACDEIMDKVKKPRGLIRYSSENQTTGENPETYYSKIYCLPCYLPDIY